MTNINEFFYHLFSEEWMKPEYLALFSKILSVAIAFLIAVLLNHLVRYFLFGVVARLVKKTKSTLDDIIINEHVLTHTSKLVMPIVIYALTPLVLPEDDFWYVVLERFSLVFITVASIRLISSIFVAIYKLYNEKEKYRNRPLKGLLQTMQVMLIIVGAIVVIGILIDRSPLALLTTLGASAAILLLVFRDSILGFVAGIQLAANDMVKVGDWITAPKHGADGNILEVTLNTVKVRNFDNTIVTVPPYALISESFQNWRGMQDTGMRRVKRAINIDANSVRFCTAEMLEHLSAINLVKKYVNEKEKEVEEHNVQAKIDTRLMVNGRRQTNLGIFRAYLENYLNNLPEVRSDALCMVRQLQPSERGIPLELYCFVNTTDWRTYENIQADIFDHVFAAITAFELRCFQNPTGQDFAALKY